MLSLSDNGSQQGSKMLLQCLAALCCVQHGMAILKHCCAALASNRVQSEQVSRTAAHLRPTAPAALDAGRSFVVEAAGNVGQT